MFTEEELSQIKVKKLHSLLEKGARVVNLRMQDFVDNTNKDLVKFKTKYEGMYNHLVRSFLVNLEKRLYGCEVISKASLEVFYVKFFELEKIRDPEFNMDFNEYTQRMNEQIQAHITLINTQEVPKPEETNEESVSQ